METRTFLQQVLPSDGLYIVARPLRVGWRNVVVASVEQALEQAEIWLWEGHDIYYALASYRERRVWNPAKPNRIPGATPGGWEVRSHNNAQALRCLFLDLDVKPERVGCFTTQVEALTDLQGFCAAIDLPRPMIVNSGRGLHIYWPFTAALPVYEWRALAERFKACVIHHGLRADIPLIADQARVLRVPGTFNFKNGAASAVTVLAEGVIVDAADLAARIDRYCAAAGVVEGAKPALSILGSTPLAAAGAQLGDNIGTTDDPVNPDQVAFHCSVFAEQLSTKGANTAEPLWRAMLGLAKHTTHVREVMLSVSVGHSGFEIQATEAKMANWTAGPPTCATLAEVSPHCAACPHFGKITSPAVLGHTLRSAPPPLLEVEQDDGTVVLMPLPTPPFPYVRTGKPKAAIAVETENAEGRKLFTTIAPYDIYPIRLLRQSGVDASIDEYGTWRMHLPQLGAVDVDMPMSLLTDLKRLHSFIMSKGYYLSPEQAKTTQGYMSAYIQHLAESTKRDKIYDRLGWHDDHRTFVMGTEAYHRDGTTTKHSPSIRIRNVTKEGLHTSGTLAGWKAAMEFYAGMGNEPYRMFVYANLAAPLFHMTGFKGVLLAASGQTGRGKTTMLEACASVWGKPEPLKVSGSSDGTTVNALYNILGTYHSLPLFWDETTERDATEMRKFVLNIPQGKGKVRLQRDGQEIAPVTWETIVLSSANTDDVSRILSTGKDSDPHIARMVSVNFSRIDTSTEAKIRADRFKRQMYEHYGHAGPIYMQYVTEHYEAIAQRVVKVMERIDSSTQAQSPERYWTATMAVAYVAAETASRLGLLTYDYKSDLQWMVDHLESMRAVAAGARSTPEDILGEFLDNHFPNILVLSTQTPHLDNIARVPHGPLQIRHEVEAGIIYVSRDVVLNYCTEIKTSFRQLELELKSLGILMEHSIQKTLGAGTPYAKGQVRCWKLNVHKMGELGTNFQQAVNAAITTGATVVPIRKVGGTK